MEPPTLKEKERLTRNIPSETPPPPQKPTDMFVLSWNICGKIISNKMSLACHICHRLKTIPCHLFMKVCEMKSQLTFIPAGPTKPSFPTGPVSPCTEKQHHFSYKMLYSNPGLPSDQQAN